MPDEYNQEEDAIGKALAGLRWSKEGKRLGRREKSAIGRAMVAKRGRSKGGRKRVVEHAPGPRGGCRCVECRRRKKVEPAVEVAPG